jgi:hypothetical protein
MTAQHLHAMDELRNAAPITLEGRGGTLLLVMDNEQKRMLQRYGHIACMDATYKVVSWGLPFFMLTVVDEHRKSFPVAYFMISHECKESIAEVLLYIRLLVPGWKPNALILDKDDAEILACKRVFPNALIILCEFHVKQAWLRWLRTGTHGIPKDKQRVLYKYMNDIMKSTSVPQASYKVSEKISIASTSHSSANIFCALFVMLFTPMLFIPRHDMT